MLDLDPTPPPTRTCTELRPVLPDGSVVIDVDLSAPMWETPSPAPRMGEPMSLTVIFDPALPRQPEFRDGTLRFGGDRAWPIAEVIELPSSFGMRMSLLIRKVRRHGRLCAEVEHRRFWGSS